MPREIYRRFMWPTVLLVAVLLVGTLGFWLIAGREASLMDSLYMTVITVATIGYGEITDVSSPVGRVFTMLTAVAGIGILSYVMTNLTAWIVEGELTRSFRRRGMEKKAARSINHYIVCGAGEVGFHIMNELQATRRKHVVVEADEGKGKKILEVFKDAVLIQGDATQDETLRKAGIENATGVFAVTADDNINLVISLTAKQLNPQARVVTRCTEITNSEKMKRAGADAVVSPTFIGGMRMASEMVRPAVVSFLDTMLRDKEANLRIEELAVPQALAGKTLADLNLKKYHKLLLVAVKGTVGVAYNPQGDYIVRPGDSLLFITDPVSLHDLETELNRR